MTHIMLPPNLRLETFKPLSKERDIHIDPRKLVLLTDGLDFYLTQSIVSVAILENAPPEHWLPSGSPLYKYDRTLIQPKANDHMTHVNEASIDHKVVFVKAPPLNSLRLRNMVEKGFPQADVTAREIQVCETLKKYPHPNICAYRGDLVQDDRVKGLCFDRYSMTLHDMVNKGLHFDADACLAAIEAGLDHLHSLNIVHCDIKPANIFVSPNPNPTPAPTTSPSFAPPYQFAIGDFDSAHAKGEILGMKSGTPAWSSSRFYNAHREMDFYGLSLVRWWLEGKGYGVLDLEEEYVSTDLILGVDAGEESGTSRERGFNKGCAPH